MLNQTQEDEQQTPGQDDQQTQSEEKKKEDEDPVSPEFQVQVLEILSYLKATEKATPEILIRLNSLFDKWFVSWWDEKGLARQRYFIFEKKGFAPLIEFLKKQGRFLQYCIAGMVGVLIGPAAQRRQ